jgi:hypothetical protein
MASGRDLVLRTPHLVLRSFRATDVDDALAHRDDRELAKFCRISRSRSRGETPNNSSRST